VIRQRRVVDAFLRLTHGMHVGADRLDDQRQLVDVHALLRREHGRQTRRMRQKIEHRDSLANAAGEFLDDLRDLRREHQLTALDGAKDEHVGDRLRRGEDAEHRIHGERLRARPALVTDRNLEPDLAGTRDFENGTEILSAHDVVANDGFGVLQ
jgi:hypothetical protein